jgi:hypothetical protein
MPVINVHGSTESSASTADGYFVTTNAFDGGGFPVFIEINPSLVTTAGKYAVVRSVNPLTNLGSPAAIATFAPSSSTLEVKAVTQESLNFSGVVYDCIAVTVGAKTTPVIPPTLTDYFVLTDSYDAGNFPIPINVNPELVPTAGKYALICSVAPMQNLATPVASVQFFPPSPTFAITYIGQEAIVIGSTLYDCIVMVVT